MKNSKWHYAILTTNATRNFRPKCMRRRGVAMLSLAAQIIPDSHQQTSQIGVRFDPAFGCVWWCNKAGSTVSLRGGGLAGTKDDKPTLEPFCSSRRIDPGRYRYRQQWGQRLPDRAITWNVTPLFLLLFLSVAVCVCVVGVSIYVICPRFTPPATHLPRLEQKSWRNV